MKQKKMYNKTCLKRPLKKRAKIVFQDPLSLNVGQKYCRMLQESILQYFRPSLSYHLSLRPLFCLFLSGLLRQALLYAQTLDFSGLSFQDYITVDYISNVHVRKLFECNIVIIFLYISLNTFFRHETQTICFVALCPSQQLWSWGMVSPPNHTFSCVNKRLTSTYLRLQLTTTLLKSVEGRRMAVEIISWSISMKVWDRAWIKLATPGCPVRHASVARHVTDSTMCPSYF